MVGERRRCGPPVAAKLGLAASPDLAEFARGYASLAEEGASEAFLAHDAQRDRPRGPAGLAPRPPLPGRPAAHDDRSGATRPGDPGRARPPTPTASSPTAAMWRSRARPLADARRSGPDRPRADRIHGGDRAVRVVAGNGARAPSPRAPAPPARRRRFRLRRGDVPSTQLGASNPPAGGAATSDVIYATAGAMVVRSCFRSGPALQARPLPGARSPRRRRPSASPSCPAGRRCPAPSSRSPC